MYFPLTQKCRNLAMLVPYCWLIIVVMIVYMLKFYLEYFFKRLSNGNGNDFEMVFEQNQNTFSPFIHKLSQKKAYPLYCINSWI